VDSLENLRVLEGSEVFFRGLQHLYHQFKSGCRLLGEIWKQLFPDFLVYKYNIPAIFLFAGANVLPTSKNNRKYIENQLSGAIEQMEEYIRKYLMFLVMDYV